MGIKLKNEPGIVHLGPGHFRVTARVRINGKIKTSQETLRCNREEAREKFHDLKAKLRGKPGTRSLKRKPILTFKNIGDFWIDRKVQKEGVKGGVQLPHELPVLMRDLGDVVIPELADRFDSYLQILRSEPCPLTGDPREVCTVNHYIAAFKRVCNYAEQFELIDKNPSSRFKKEPEIARDRILDPDERGRLFEAMLSLGSYLYWPSRFSERNPIRYSNLFGLNRTNYDRFHKWVHFYASKTRKKHDRQTCLPCLEDDMIDYFNGLPSVVDLLFPRFRNGRWEQVISIKTHWGHVKDVAKVEDFTWHDWKHASITWMLDAGFTERDLKNLGIQYSSKMIERYYKRDALKAQKTWEKIKNQDQCEGPVKASEVKKVSNWAN